MPADLSPVLILAAILGGYLLGSVPFGVVAMKLAGAGDPRSIGSGNIGATNVLRSGRKDLAALTLIGDSGKGAFAVLIAWILTKHASKDAQSVLTCLAASAAFLGHIFPVFLGFKGGKGVATFFGTLLAAAWPVGLAAGATWLAVAFFLRLSSLAALSAAALAPLYAVFVFDQPYPVAAMSLLMAVLIFVRHKENIGRLLKGEEPKIGAKKPETPAA